MRTMLLTGVAAAALAGCGERPAEPADNGLELNVTLNDGAAPAASDGNAIGPRVGGAPPPPGVRPVPSPAPAPPPSPSPPPPAPAGDVQPNNPPPEDQPATEDQYIRNAPD